MGDLEKAIDALQKAVLEYDDYLGRRIVSKFPELGQGLRQIRDLLTSMDLHHLSNAPYLRLNDITKAVKEATSCIKDYLLQSFPAEDQTPRGGGEVRSYNLVQNQGNIQRWRATLTQTYGKLFDLIGPIVSQQQARIVSAATGVPLAIDRSRSMASDSAEDQIVWRYMPLRNLLRSEAACGIWMSSLRSLRAWSETHIEDTREGQIPPIVAQLKKDFENAGASSGTEGFRKAYPFTAEELARLPNIFGTLSIDAENTFVSSWVQRRAEQAHMWKLYGDSGSGVAINVKSSKLLGHAWKVPADVGGVVGPMVISSIVIRHVQYLTYTAADKLPALDDLHLPFLKPDEFEAEHEVRVVAFSASPLARAGFTLLANLADLIDEIVIGPRADFEKTVDSIKLHAPDLRDVKIRRSTLPLS